MKMTLIAMLAGTGLMTFAQGVNQIPELPLRNVAPGTKIKNAKNWWGSLANAVVTADVPPGTPGGRALCLDFSDKPHTNDWGIACSRIRIDPKKSYRLSVHLKTEGLKQGYGSTFGFYYSDKEQKNIAGSDYPHDKTMRALYVHQGPAEWKYYSIELKPAKEIKKKYAATEIPPDTAFISVIFGAYNYQGKVYFTQPVLEEFSEGGSQTLPGDEKQQEVTKLSTPPTIDGKLTETAWNQPSDDFFTTICPIGKTRSISGEISFRTAVDNDFFYVSATSKQPENKTTATAKGNENSALYADDYIDFMFDPSGKRSGKYFQFVINPNNSVTARWIGGKYRYEFKSAVTRTPDSWSVEFAVPMKRIIQLCAESGLAVNPYSWDFNIGRFLARGGDKKFMTWSYSGEREFCNTKNTGTILFTSPQKALLARYDSGIVELTALQKEFAGLLNPSKDAPPQVSELAKSIKDLFALYRADREKIAKTTTLTPLDFSLFLCRSRNMLADAEVKCKYLKRLAFTVPEECRKYGFAVWRLPSLTLPDTNAIPENDRITNALSVRGARNSTVSLQFGIFPFAELKNLTFELSDLRSPEGAVIPATACAIRFITDFQKQAALLTTDSRIKLSGFLPEDYNRKPAFQESLNAFSPQFVFLKIPTGAKAGTFTGTLTVKSSGKPNCKISLKTEVLPFDLEAPGKDYGFFYLGVLDKKIKSASPIYSGNATKEEMKKELNRLYADGCRIVTLYCYTTGALNPKYVSETMKLAHDAGFRQVILLGAEHIFTSGDSSTPEKKIAMEEQAATLKQKLAAVKKCADELGIKCYIYTVDEALSEKALERLRKFSTAVHESGLESACALIFEQARKAAEGKTDLVMMAWGVVAKEDFNTEFNRSVREGKPVAHKRVFYYPILANTPGLERIVFGWYLYKSRYEGCFPWGWYEFASKGQPNWKTIRYVVQTSGEPMSTLKYEGALEGILDMRYIRTLEKLIAGTKDSAKKAKAAAVLKGLTDSFPLDNSSGFLNGIRPETYETMRNSMIDAILALQ